MSDNKYLQKLRYFFQNIPGKLTFKKTMSFFDFLEKGLDSEATQEPGEFNEKPIPLEELPTDLSLRQSGVFRKIYETIFPVSHGFRISFKYGREYLDQFMPLSNEAYIGRGSYKFVYQLPWNQVVKISKSKLPSDPIFGSLFFQVGNQLDKYLKPEEWKLLDFLSSKIRSKTKKEKLKFKFIRLGMERLHYWKLKSLIPDLIVPTRFYMGLRVRKNIFPYPLLTLTPFDNQPIIPGKHLKEFAKLTEKLKQNPILDKLSPKWKLNFDSNKFGIIKNYKLKKIAKDFERVILATKYLAQEEKLIFDIHSENIIITIPDFELKIFDYHVFDEHLYQPSRENPSPEIDHIQIIEEFVRSFDLK